MHYTIIIPIYNEEKLVPQLLNELKYYSKENQILVINDGSTDSSNKILSQCNFITLKTLNKNHGKGHSVRVGIKEAYYDKILITDGDLELKTSDLLKFMILDKSNNINVALGDRFNKIEVFKSIWNFGNYFFKVIFNTLHSSKLNDVLCCAKSFYKNDINLDSINSKGFDIDIELNSYLIQKFNNVNIIPLSYTRRNTNEGKKVSLYDGFKILFRVFTTRY